VVVVVQQQQKKHSDNLRSEPLSLIKKREFR